MPTEAEIHQIGRMAAYYVGKLEQMLEEQGPALEDDKIAGYLWSAGLPVTVWAIDGHRGYFTWSERHLYTDELRLWSQEHKRQRAH